MNPTETDMGPVQTVPSRCGCAGKTPLSDTVRPALSALRDRLESVRIAGELEAGLLPNTSSLQRAVIDDDELQAFDSRPRVVAAAFVDDERGGDVAAFRDLLAAVYRRWSRVTEGTTGSESRRSGGDTRGEVQTASGQTVVKGHSIQLDGATKPIVWGERLVPTGRRQPGYRAVNVDVVHAFPELTPERQAAVAAFHALNDCYTQGATENRALRPIVAAPSGTELSRRRVQQWFRAAVPRTVTVHTPSIVTHDGRGWQFGASTSAVTSRTPPVRRAAIGPGDEVVVHRPLGALALYAGTADPQLSLPETVRDRAVEALTADHVAVARAIAASCPAAGDQFDPTRHLKWVCDISGPGLGGLVRTLRDEHCGFRLEALPLLDQDGVDAVRGAWIVPDGTVETNGPLAAVGTSSALEEFERRLEALPAADPSRIGSVTRDGGLHWDTDIDLERYAERLTQ